MMSNYSKIRDLVMRASILIQAMEASLAYLFENRGFAFSNEDTLQLMLLNILRIKPEFVRHAVVVIEASQIYKVFLEKLIVKNFLSKKEIQLIEKHDLFLKGNEFSGTRNLVRRRNTYNRKRHT